MDHGAWLIRCILSDSPGAELEANYDAYDYLVKFLDLHSIFEIGEPVKRSISHFIHGPTVASTNMHEKLFH